MLIGTRMRIGSANSFLSIEKDTSQGSACIWQLEAAMTGDSWSFAYADGHICVESSRELRKELIAFEAIKTQRLHIMLSEGGWLRVKRDARGYILIAYQLAQLSAGATVRGEVVLEPESGSELCRQLALLL